MSNNGDRPSVQGLVAGIDPAALARAFGLRPDLVVPPPGGLRELAERVSSQRSVALAVAGCDRWCRQLIEVALLLRGPTSALAIAELIRTSTGEIATEGQVLAGVDRLAERLLLFVDDDKRIWLNPGVVPLVPRPCGLGAPVAELLAHHTASTMRSIVTAIGARLVGQQKSAMVAAIAGFFADAGAAGQLLATAPPEAIAVLRDARSGYVSLPYPGWGRPSPSSDSTARGWLLAHGLIVDRHHGYGQAEIPREVMIALRGGVAVVNGAPECPPLAAVEVGAVADLDRRGAAQAAATIRSITRLLGVLDATPAQQLKDGGVGAREGARLAKSLDVHTEAAFVLLEMAVAAELVTHGWTQPVTPTTAADTWQAAAPADRWLELAVAWLDAPGIPSIAGRKAPDGKTVPGLVTVNGVDGRALRRAALDLLARAAPGERAAGDLVGAVSWSEPNATSGLPADIVGDLVSWTVAEAVALGLAVDGALTTVGRLLHAGDITTASELVASLLVEAPAEVILQADLTAVIDAAAPQRVLDELRLMADEESTGSAVVLRFSASSLRRAFDAGRDAAEIRTFLAAHAVRGVPQPLDYLVTDTARRWGSLRIGAVGSYVRADDPALLADAIRHRRLAKVGLRLLAPTVAVSEHEPAKLVAALRDAGFLPVEEDDAGVTLLGANRRERAAAPARRPARPTAEPVDLRALAHAVLAAGNGPDPTTPSRAASRPTALAIDQPKLTDWFDSAGEVVFDDVEEDLDPVQLLDTLVGLLDAAAIVELRYEDADTGGERAATGMLADVDLRAGVVTVEREPDGMRIVIDLVDLFEIRVLQR